MKRHARAQRQWGGAGVGAIAAAAVLATSGPAWAVAVLAALAALFVAAVCGWRADDAGRLLAELDARPVS